MAIAMNQQQAIHPDPLEAIDPANDDNGRASPVAANFSLRLQPDALMELAQRSPAPPAGSQPVRAPTDRSMVIDQAYGEYCRLLVARQAPPPEEFCRGFPGIQSSLQR